MHTGKFTDDANRVSLELLLVEDSPGNVQLTQEAFQSAKMAVHLSVVTDGVEAMAFLK